MDEQIKILHKEYVKSRKIQISEDQFDYLARLYPALLVCMRDGVLDDEEWDGIVMVTRGLAAEFVKSPDDDRDMLVVGNPVKMSRADEGPITSFPRLGEHTDGDCFARGVPRFWCPALPVGAS